MSSDFSHHGTEAEADLRDALTDDRVRAVGRHLAALHRDALQVGGKLHARGKQQLQVGLGRRDAAVQQAQSTLEANALKLKQQQEELQRQAAARELKKQQMQAALDKTYAELKKDRTDRAQVALKQSLKQTNGTMLSWQSYLNDDGTLKAKGQKVNGFEIPEDWYNETGTIQWARDAWKKWYNSTAGTYQRAKDEYGKKAQKTLDDYEKATQGGFFSLNCIGIIRIPRTGHPFGHFFGFFLTKGPYQII